MSNPGPSSPSLLQSAPVQSVFYDFYLKFVTFYKAAIEIFLIRWPVSWVWRTKWIRRTETQMDRREVGRTPRQSPRPTSLSTTCRRQWHRRSCDRSSPASASWRAASWSGTRLQVSVELTGLAAVRGRCSYSFLVCSLVFPASVNPALQQGTSEYKQQYNGDNGHSLIQPRHSPVRRERLTNCNCRSKLGLRVRELRETGGCGEGH